MHAKYACVHAYIHAHGHSPDNVFHVSQWGMLLHVLTCKRRSQILRTAKPIALKFGIAMGTFHFSGQQMNGVSSKINTKVFIYTEAYMINIRSMVGDVLIVGALSFGPGSFQMYGATFINL